jgi:hypothetical protein
MLVLFGALRRCGSTELAPLSYKRHGMMPSARLLLGLVEQTIEEGTTSL